MKKRKLKIKNVILALIIIIFSTTLIISLYNIIIWHLDNRNINNELEEINDIVEVQEIEDDDNTEIINQDENNKDEEPDKDNPYWNYIKMNLINVDFSNLKSENSDTVGWIQVNGTNINYPFVQTKDNDYYLKHSFNRNYNNAGWVFLDYRNNLSNLDKNTIIYAHGRYDGTMFGSLKNILTSGWLKNTDNYVIKLSTEYENTLWQVFSVYRIPTTNDYIQVKFTSNEQFLQFANMLKERSQFDFKTDVSENDHILTLSTCYNDNEKVVLHAKLIKKGTR